MNSAVDTHPIEMTVDAAAALIFAAASAFMAFLLFGYGAVPAALLTFVPAFIILRRVPSGRGNYALPPFDLLPMNFAIGEGGRWEELLLTAERMFSPMADEARPTRTDDELLLDDVLTRPGPDSRVVQLFESSTVPTAGELKTRIDRHLRTSQQRSNSLDASQALSDALAQLRRSLH